MTDERAPLPHRWTWASLGELGEYHNGRGFKKSEWASDGLPIIRIQNLTDPTRPHNYFEGDDLDPRHRVSNGELLVSWAATLDVFRWHGGDAAVNQHIFKVKSYIDPEYHYWALKAAVNEMRARAHGTGMVHVTRDQFLSIEVPLPPREEQTIRAEALTDALDRVGALRSELDERLRACEVLEQSILHQALDVARGEGDSTPLSVLAEMKYGYTASAVAEREGPRFVRITDLQAGTIDWESVPFCAITDKQAPAYALAAGDIVVARTGGTIGKSFLLPQPPEASVFASYLIRIRAIDQVVPEYLAMFMQSLDYWSQLRSIARGTGQPNVNTKTLGSLSLPLPSVERQRELHADAQRHIHQLQAVRRSLQTALGLVETLEVATLRDGLFRVAGTPALSVA